jgi:hypothetical protein
VIHPDQRGEEKLLLVLERENEVQTVSEILLEHLHKHTIIIIIPP